MEKIFEYIPRECVPTDIGGTLPKTRAELNRKWKTFQINKSHQFLNPWLRFLAEIEKVRMAILEDIVMEEMSLKSDESKRTGNQSKDFTRNASFKQLQIDWLIIYVSIN